MPSPICQSAWTKLNPGSAACDLLKNLSLIQEKLYTFWGWMFTDTTEGCILSEDFVRETLEMLQPIGTVVWAPMNLSLKQEEWLPCDGAEYDIDKYKTLGALFGLKFGTPSVPTKFKVPNLQGRVVLQTGQRIQTLPDGFSPQFDLGETGGEDTFSPPISAALKSHQHGFGCMESDRNEDSTWPDGETDNDKGCLSVKQPIGTTSPVEIPYAGQVFDAAMNASIAIQAGNLKVTRFITTGGLTDNVAHFDEDSNWPPYFTGIYYIKANYVYNGKVL